MASDGENRANVGKDEGGRHAYGAEQNASPEVEGRDDVVADNDASQRASGEAAGLAGAGTPGAGGGPGGTPDAGGLGLSGGVRRLGAGKASTRDAREGDAPLTSSLGTPGNAAAGSSEAHPLATPDTQPQGLVHGMEYPRAPQRRSEQGHGGHLSVAGGSAGSGGGGGSGGSGTDVLDEVPREDAQDDGGEVESPPSS
ncbi:MAG: hypothetical protein ACXVCX_00005 [Ktedonobacterales bacterium]